MRTSECQNHARRSHAVRGVGRACRPADRREAGLISVRGRLPSCTPFRLAGCTLHPRCALWTADLSSRGLQRVEARPPAIFLHSRPMNRPVRQPWVLADSARPRWARFREACRWSVHMSHMGERRLFPLRSGPWGEALAKGVVTGGMHPDLDARLPPPRVTRSPTRAVTADGGVLVSRSSPAGTGARATERVMAATRAMLDPLATNAARGCEASPIFAVEDGAGPSVDRSY
ncbi:hypothetical protein T492DRAFT_835302 [Pavlovales sp. CCMP2436]|nr:hypothetical protein T492DRAFT_835302 [Pavlovales sp. CCMP2436]